MIRLEFKRLGVVGERRLVVARLAKREAEQIADIGLLDVLGEIPQFGESGGIVLASILARTDVRSGASVDDMLSTARAEDDIRTGARPMLMTSASV